MAQTLLPEFAPLQQNKLSDLKKNFLVARDFPSTPTTFPSNITVTNNYTNASQDAPAVRVRIYNPHTVTGARPAFLWIHGGCFIFGTPESDDAYCAQYALGAKCVVVSVDYRLAPEHKYPAGLEDCYTSLLWLVSNAAELGVDPARIAVGGASAGGCLATAVALLARDRNGPKLVHQLLIYPTVDNTITAHSTVSQTNAPLLSIQLLHEMWDMYLGRPDYTSTDVPQYAAPSRAKNLSGLPPAYVQVCELDVLRDEGLAFASRLLEAGVSTELVLLRGTPHAFRLIPQAPTTIRATADSVRVLNAAFYPSNKL